VALTGSYYLYWRSIRQVLRRPRWRCLVRRASGRCADAAVPIVQPAVLFLVAVLSCQSLRRSLPNGAVQRAHARYLLPLSGLLVPLAGIELLDLADRRSCEAAVFLLTAIMVALGALSASEFKAFNFLWTNPSQRWTESKRLQQVFNYLYVKDVRRVFSKNACWTRN